MNQTENDRLKQNAAAMLARADGKPVQYKPRNRNCAWITIRPPGPLAFDCSYNDYRPAPEPKVRPWSKPEDVPGPVCWMRQTGTKSHGLVAWIDEAGIGAHGMASNSTAVTGLMYEQLHAYEYSTDRKTWKPCTVEVSE